jgi:hypothetical protein
MDLSLMEKKINRDRYPDMLSLWQDMDLTRRNCHAYSELKGFADMGFLADLTADIFRYLLKLVATEVQDLGCNEGSLFATLLPSPEAREAIMHVVTPPEVVTFYESLFEKRRLAAEREQAEAAEATERALERTLERAVSVSSPAVSSSGGQKLKISFKQPPTPTPTHTSSPTPHSCDPDESDLNLMAFDDSQYQQPPVSAKRAASKGSAAKKGVRAPSFVAAPYHDSVTATATSTIDSSMVVESGGVQLEAWELACYDLLKKISKHEFIDTTKAGKAGVVVVDFYHPVVELYPSIEDAYLAVITQPMDLSTIYRRLDMRGYLDAEDFFLKLILIFQNSITYNSPAIEDNDYLKSVVLRCELMIKYVTWLAHEMLPCIDDTTKEDEQERQALGSLRESLRDVYRLDRLAVIENYSILSGGRECFALIKKFEIRKYNKELCYFI